MAEVRLVVLYPRPTDAARFDRDYQEHLRLLHKKMGIPEAAKPYTVTRFVETPMGKPAFHQMFSMPFPSMQALNEAMNSPAMQELGADAARISTGGAPVTLIGT